MRKLGYTLETAVSMHTKYLFRATPHNSTRDIMQHANAIPKNEHTHVIESIEGFRQVIQHILGTDVDPDQYIRDMKVYSEVFMFDNKWHARAYANNIGVMFSEVIISQQAYSFLNQREKWTDFQKQFAGFITRRKR